jgi:hypothetical protein
MRKLIAAVGVAGLMVALGAGPAFAHDCYNASRSAQGNASIAAHSPSFTTFDQAALGFFQAPQPDGLGLCPAGAQVLLQAIHDQGPALGFDPNVVISTRVVQAGGIANSPNPTAQGNLSNGVGIDHLDENVTLNQLIGANIQDAIAAC